MARAELMGKSASAVHILPGTESLSAFRVQRLLERLRLEVPGVKSLRVLDFYLAQVEGPAPSGLRRLLGPGPETFPAAQTTLYVVPRLGTVSPWSSKATDIARVCGLSAVNRIEMGRAYLFDFKGEVVEASHLTKRQARVPAALNLPVCGRPPHL